MGTIEDVLESPSSVLSNCGVVFGASSAGSIAICLAVL